MVKFGLPFCTLSRKTPNFTESPVQHSSAAGPPYNLTIYKIELCKEQRSFSVIYLVCVLGNVLFLVSAGTFFHVTEM